MRDSKETSAASAGGAFGAAAMVIQWHVVGMYAPGFFTGSLIKRFGVLKVILAGVAVIAGGIFACLVDEIHPKPDQIVDFRFLSVAHSSSCIQLHKNSDRA